MSTIISKYKNKLKYILYLISFFLIVIIILILTKSSLQNACFNNANDVAILPPQWLNSKQLNFIVLGDSGKNSSTLQNISKSLQEFCLSHECQFGIMLGDNFYENGVFDVQDQQFKDTYVDNLGQLDFNFFAILGNHDIIQNPLAQIEYSKINFKWLQPNINYLVQSKIANFYFTNSNCNLISKFWVEINYVNDKKWQILAAHHSFYSNGPHGDSSELKNYFWSGLLKKINLVLTGHNHVQELLIKDSTIHLTSGAASKPELLASLNNTVATSLFYNSKGGSTYVQIQENCTKITFLDEYSHELEQHSFDKQGQACNLGNYP